MKFLSTSLIFTLSPLYSESKSFTIIMSLVYRLPFLSWSALYLSIQSDSNIFERVTAFGIPASSLNISFILCALIFIATSIASAFCFFSSGVVSGTKYNFKNS